MKDCFLWKKIPSWLTQISCSALIYIFFTPLSFFFFTSFFFFFPNNFLPTNNPANSTRDHVIFQMTSVKAVTSYQKKWNLHKDGYDKFQLIYFCQWSKITHLKKQNSKGGNWNYCACAPFVVKEWKLLIIFVMSRKSTAYTTLQHELQYFW